MSLKARLRIAIIGLVVTVVIALSLLYLRTVADSLFWDIGDRGRMVATETAGLVDLVVRERAATFAAAGSEEESRRQWASIVRQDPMLPAMFAKMLRTPKAILDIVVSDREGVVLCAVAAAPGDKIRNLAPYESWEKVPFYQRLWRVWKDDEDTEVTVPLGTPGTDHRPVFQVHVIISSVLIRNLLKPALAELGLVSMLSLAGSLALAITVTRFVSRPMERMMMQIDRISAGVPAPAAPVKPQTSRMTAREFSVMESKLDILGQRYRGAQADVMQLRSNLEWMMQRLEQAVLLTDPLGRLSMVGPSAERLLGKARTELIGSGLEAVFPRDSQAGAIIANALERREAIRDIPVLLERLGEQPLKVLLNVEPLENLDTGQGLGGMITLRDAETRRQIRSQLDVTTRLEAINRVTGGVAHEIKNPLNAIALHLEVLKGKIRQSESGDEQDMAQEVRIIGREIMRLDRVVKTFLDFNRPLELKLKQVDLSALAREVATLVRPHAQTRGVELELSVERENSIVSGDHDMLLQALLNVVNNAVEAMDSMPKPGVVHLVVAEAGEDEFALRVVDQGCGISPEKQGKIFNLYYTTKEQGSGIGLAMTFRVVQLHHGRIDFRSEPGRGTTFELVFPAWEAGQGSSGSQTLQAAVGDRAIAPAPPRYTS